MAAPTIMRLDEVVVNRIAAGEVIQRPANALKELLENSIDAGSTNVSVLVKQGGLKLLQITDNGHGIRKADFDIVCERFTTSKLQKFEDLNEIATFGFRGEALASVSHVAHLTITSRTAESPCAYRASYRDGKLVDPVDTSLPGKVKACAGTVGTQITVEDLFYNVSTRKKALKSTNEEYHRLLDVVIRYSIHYAGVSMSLKKFGEASPDVHTQTGASIKDNISEAFGQEIGKELLHFEMDDKEWEFKASGYVTNANYSSKKRLFILFINRRWVESSTVRKAVEGVFAQYLPRGARPFVYLDLRIKPQNVDVNVHPTKMEVHFMHEDDIIASVVKKIEETLLGSNASRVFYTQMLLPGQRGDALESAEKKGKTEIEQRKKVRTDSHARTLESMMFTKAKTTGKRKHDEVDGAEDGEPPAKRRSPSPQLHSIRQLLAEIRTFSHEDLLSVVRKHKFVGAVDQFHALVQHQTKLYIANVGALSKALAYQLAIRFHGRMGAIQLSTPAPIFELAMLALDDPNANYEESDGPKDEIAKYVEEMLVSKAELLHDYYSMEIDDKGRILSLPQLIPGYVPDMYLLPMFVLRLCTDVNWEKEVLCFESIALELSNFYRVHESKTFHDEAMEKQAQGGEEDAEASKKTTAWMIEHCLFPAMRKYLHPPQRFATDGTFLEIASLEDLYKVFERC